MMRFLLTALLIVAMAPLPQVDVLEPGYWERTPLPQTGLATFYAPGMMEHVLAVRASHGQILRCDECVGTVALLRAGDIGRKVWLQPPGGEMVGPFLVIDCAQREDVALLVARNWVVDVSYELGQLWGMDRPLDGVTVLADPADETSSGAAGVASPPTPFYVPSDKVVLSAPTPTPFISPTPWHPTPWPTRVPGPLSTVARHEPPSASPADQTSSVAPRPTPLTPIVTTPTPRTPTSTIAPAAVGTSFVLPSSTVTPTEVAVGRPGAGLLVPSGTPTIASTPTPSPSVTAMYRRSPSATSQPLLPRATATPPPPRSRPAGLLEWLGTLLGVVRP